MDSVLRNSNSASKCAFAGKRELFMPNLDTDIRSTVTSSTVHLLFLLALGYFMLREVPRFDALFEDLDLVLSEGFLVVRDTTEWLMKNRLIFAGLACAGLVIDGFVFLQLRRHVSKTCSRIYGWAISILLVGTIGVVMLTLGEMLARILRS